ncbi:putative RND efflux membrane fusion protein [Pseudomonas sp. M47T1]|uniref:efflux RND transporter periplasmic adaptor subunit n=1 Tax=Pseudomonas sp. M47T1 TaxID=1179778 RepID=UPI0002607803|nr:efflux RND transporter periplasmic adaptor subunit [Pseudomonas sp. M47T1]EIK98072.1 putative RND efflux membrane fusion protein [Pseudomonas sp. M47T1]
MLRRRMLIMLGIVLVVVLLLGGYKAWAIYQQIQMFSAPKPPVAVAVATASERAWQARLPAVGSLKALQGINLSLEVAGTVRAILFESGQQVKAGQPLLQLDSDVETALLGTAQADLGLAQVDYARGAQLVDSRAISKGEFDRLNAVLLKNKAIVAQLKASLAKKNIVAPFSGTIGIRKVDVGDYLASGTVIATLQDLSSLYVDFYVAEQAIPQVHLGQPLLVSVAAYPGQTFEGVISALNPKVEDSTRNILVRATLDNPQGRLLPGMFANLQVLLPQPKNQVVVPESAVAYTLYGNSVYVVEAKKDAQGQPVTHPDGKPAQVADRRFVETGERRDGLVIVNSGLKAGEQVVTGGQLKLTSGASVSVSPDATLKTR